MRDQMILQMEIYLAELDGRGREQQGKRPVVILKEDTIGTELVIVATITSNVTRWDMPFHVPVVPSVINGLHKPSVIQAEQIRALSTERLIKRIGRLENQYGDMLDNALAIAVGLAESRPDASTSKRQHSKV